MLPINDVEFERSTDDEVRILRRNAKLGERVNKKLCRSQYYPFPGNLCFSAEMPVIGKWAYGKNVLVEIGVFEGASALKARRAMSPEGELHLIDPFIVVPDSRLTARPIMAKLNLLRSRNGKVIWHVDNSFDVVKTWNKEIDYLLIDGDHTESACRQDWNDWHRFVKVGGTVLFHDARSGRGDGSSWDGWPGPSHVVNELFRGSNQLPNWKIVEETGSLVAVERVS